jgi:hypothetical protein
MMGEKITYAEHRKRQRDYERRVWDSLTAVEQAFRWGQRELWLWTEHLRLRQDLPHHIIRIERCPRCCQEKPKAAHWPSHHSCRCQNSLILDLWLPDGIERVTMKDPVDLEQFVRTGARLGNLFDYPLADRIEDLRGPR